MDNINQCMKELNNLRQYTRNVQQKSYKEDFIEVGDFTYGIPEVHWWGALEHKLIIGKFCSIADNVKIILGGEHRIDWASTYPFNSLIPSFTDVKGHPFCKGDITIGNDVWIASGVKILSGVTIGDGCVIGANSLVTSDLEDYSVYGGNPARFIKQRFSSEIIKKFKEMQWWNWPDNYLCVSIPLLQSNQINELIMFYEEYVKCK